MAGGAVDFDQFVGERLSNMQRVFSLEHRRRVRGVSMEYERKIKDLEGRIKALRADKKLLKAQQQEGSLPGKPAHAEVSPSTSDSDGASENSRHSRHSRCADPTAKNSRDKSLPTAPERRSRQSRTVGSIDRTAPMDTVQEIHSKLLRGSSAKAFGRVSFAEGFCGPTCDNPDEGLSPERDDSSRSMLEVCSSSSVGTSSVQPLFVSSMTAVAKQLQQQQQQQQQPDSQAQQQQEEPPMPRSFLGVVPDASQEDDGSLSASFGNFANADEEVQPVLRALSMGSYPFSDVPDGARGKGDFQLLPTWQELVQNQNRQRSMKLSRSVRDTYSRDIWQMDFEPITENESATLSLFVRFVVMSPNSRRRFTWDMLSMALISWDVMVLPMQFFEMPEYAILHFMMWMTRIFWTIDMFVSCIAGYGKPDGSVELRPRAITWRYFRTWFCLDLIVVGGDWLEDFLADASGIGFARMGKTARFLRMMRMMRLIRLARAPRLLEVFLERVRSERLAILLRIAGLLLGIVVTIHIIACIWFGVGLSVDTGWVYRNGYSDTDLPEKYSISFHWALTQFIGSMDLQPAHAGERFFTVGVLLFAFTVATSFVSNITSAMTRLQLISGREYTQAAMLRRYLNENLISQKLMMRVQNNAQHVIAERRRNTSELDVELLSLVSEPLRIEVHYEIFVPVLKIHPLFQRLAECNPPLTRKICHVAASWRSFSRGDVLFTEGEKPAEPSMRIITHGTLVYQPEVKFDGAGSTTDGEQESRGSIQFSRMGSIVQFRGEFVGHGNWVSEAALWTSWVHRGTLKSSASSCRVLVLNTSQVQECARSFQSDDDLMNYAAVFVDTLNHAKGHATDVGKEGDVFDTMDEAFPADSYAEGEAERTSERRGSGSRAGRWSVLVFRFRLVWRVHFYSLFAGICDRVTNGRKGPRG